METTEKPIFYTTGEYFTNYLRDFLESGDYKRVYNVLKEGNASDELIKKFFLFEVEFTGDTRKDDFYLQPCLSVNNISEILFTGIKTIFNLKENRKHGFEIYHLKKASKEIEDLQYLLKAVPYEEIFEKIWRQIIESEGYKIATLADSLYNNQNGVILANGEFILCDYQEHKNLYPLLCYLGFSSDSYWIDDIKCIHITSGQISGKVGYDLDAPEYRVIGGYDNSFITDQQIKTLFTFKENVSGLYSDCEGRTTSELIRGFIVEKNNLGGKFGNLSFLKQFYSDKINLPIFSSEILDLSYEKVFMRTSPKYSLPGLLNSRLIDNTQHNFILNKNFIQHEFEKVKDLRKDNELHWFFQQHLEGQNGVAHYYKKNEFEYLVSEAQGGVVGGSNINSILHPERYKELRAIASMLFNDLQKPLQLEFVIHDNKVFIVQLRILENNPETTVLMGFPKDVLYQGKTFSKGTIDDVKIEDILIVESEAKSEELIGKKALIVKADINFSHILALSKALNIPSMYAVGDIDLSKYTEINFIAYNKESFICKK